MDFRDYIQRLSFRFMGPNVYYKGFKKLSGCLKQLNISLEVINTVLPENRREMKATLHELLEIPRMSTFAIGAVINKGVSEMRRNCCFVNVGVWHGFSFLAGMKDNPDKKCIGVDNFSQFGGPREQFMERFNRYKSPNHRFYDIDYKEYFAKVHAGGIGFYIYDGDHDYENQMEGLRVPEPFFSEKCIILVDDTNSDEPRQATLDFVAERSQRYKILLDRTTLFNMHPTLWNGLMILQKVR